MRTVSEARCFDGTQTVLAHASEATGCEMTLALFRPAVPRPPVLWFLSGLTCTHENAMTKAGLQAHAARHGIAVAFPDTSPRGEDVADEDAMDMGQGAGFYVDATREPWSRHYRMESYVADELPRALADFDLDLDRQAVAGHSMGGHGALTLALKHPGRYRSVSAFAPIANPSESEWGRRQLEAYVGDPAPHDATALLAGGAALPPTLIDVGTADPFYDRLGIPAFAAALAETRSDAALRLRPGYDHSYSFVSTFAGAHVAFHARHLR